MNKRILLLFMIALNVQAEDQDALQGTEIERAALVMQNNLLDLEIDIARKKGELAKLNQKPVESGGFVHTQLPILIGVRGQGSRLTAVLRLGRMPLTLKLGEQFDDYKLKRLTPLCATFEKAGVEFRRCLSSDHETTSPPIHNSQTPAAISPLPGSVQATPNKLPGSN